MKKMYRLCGAIALLALTAACNNEDIYNPEKSKNTSELRVPANFDWAMTRSVNVSISSPVTTSIALYGDPNCREQLAEAIVSNTKPAELTIELPTAASQIFLQYSVKGVKKVVAQTIGATTRAADVNTALPEDVDGFYPSEENPPKGEMSIYMPAKEGYGTLMFEDMYPSKGDYDMNDFVAAYKIAAFTSGLFGLSYDYGSDIELQIRAIGGTNPYRLCMELSGLLTSDLFKDDVPCYTTSTTDPNIQVELISEGDKPAVFAINGTNTLKDGIFFNTEKASSTAMPTVKLSISRQVYDDFLMTEHYGTLCASENYNFFLQNTDNGQEIHLLGYETTFDEAPNKGSKFATSDNLVWGIKVPALIAHPMERTDICTAYTRFASWVTSGGANDKDWYTSCDESKVIR